MKKQRSFTVIFIGLFSLSLLASVFGFSLIKVTAKAQPNTTTATFSLAGNVVEYCPPLCKPPGPPGLPGVTLTFTRVTGSGIVPASVQTGTDGKWSQTGFEEGTTYRVTPSGLAIKFSPAFLDYSSENNQIFFAVAPPTFSVSGRVTFNGAGLEGVRIDLVGLTGPTLPPVQEVASTDANGNWNLPTVRAFTTRYIVYPSKAGYLFTPCPQEFFIFPQGQLNFEASPVSFAVVSSADFAYRPGYCSYPTVAQESIVSAFGSGLATATQVATTQPLPTELAGTSVKIKDIAGVERDAPLFFVSPNQINFQVAPGTSSGFPPSPASIKLMRNGTVIKESFINVTVFQPAFFTADASGTGLPAAVLYRLKANGAESYEPIARFDPVQGKLVAVPIEFGNETEQFYLVLFGTGGIAQAGVGTNIHTDLQSYEITIGNTPAQVTYVGMQPSYVGLVQTNVLLPRSLIGRGDAEVRLRAIGREANPVTINIH